MEINSVINETTTRNSFIQLNYLISRRIYSISKIHLRRHILFKDSDYLNINGCENSSNH